MKTKLRKTLALLMAAIMLLSMAACSGNTDAGNTGNNSTATGNQSGGDGLRRIVIQALSDPGTFTAFDATSSVSSQFQGAFYEPLFALYEAGELTPVVATGYERVGEGVYEISIHDGVYDSKGNAVTVDDIVWNLQTVIAEGKRSTVYGNVGSVEKIDDQSFRLTFKGEEFVGDFENIMTSTAVISKASYEESETGFASDPIGTGPYKIKSWTSGSSLILEKNEDYWNKETMESLQPYDEIEYRFIGESTQVALALETGEVNMALGVSAQDVSKFTEDKGFQTIPVVDILTRAIVFNCDASNPCSDVRVRQAIAYAIDSEALIAAVTDGTGSTCKGLAGALDNSTFPDYNMEWNDEPYYEYDPEKAKELLAEAGYADGLHLRLMTKDTPEYNTTCQIMQGYLAEVGIEVEILAYENALYQTYRYDPTAFDMNLAQIGGTPESVLIPWKWFLQPNPDNNNMNVCMFYDENFWENIYGPAARTSTHSQETVDAAWEWMNENLPMYAYGFTYKYFIFDDSVIDPFISPTGWHYPWLDGHAE